MNTTKHGMSGSAVYTAWADMKQRCYNPNNSRYSSYGGRGITVAEKHYMEMRDCLNENN